MRTSTPLLTVAVGALVGTLLGVLPSSAQAQVIIGTVRDSATSNLLDGAMVSLTDSDGVTISEVRTDANGRFEFNGDGITRGRFLVRKLGVTPTMTSVLELPPRADTINVDLAAPLVGVTLATLRVIGEPAPLSTFNAQQLRDAKRAGWRVVDPKRIEKHRIESSTLADLVRRNPVGGVQAPRGQTGCFTHSRSNNCLTIVVDGQVLGPQAFVAPDEVYFIAFLTAAQSNMQYGVRAPDGALFIATRRQDGRKR